jgi:hypothetical protein
MHAGLTRASVDINRIVKNNMCEALRICPKENAGAEGKDNHRLQKM